VARVDYWEPPTCSTAVTLRAVRAGLRRRASLSLRGWPAWPSGSPSLASDVIAALDRDARMIALARSWARRRGPGRLRRLVEADYLALPRGRLQLRVALREHPRCTNMEIMEEMARMAREMRTGEV